MCFKMFYITVGIEMEITTSSKIIGIIGAMNDEVDTLKSSLSDTKISTFAGMHFFEGKIDGINCVVVKCKYGKAKCRSLRTAPYQ